MDFIDAFPGIRAVPYITKTDGQEFQVIEIVENNAGEGQINKMDFIDAFPGIRVVPYITKTDGSAYKTYAELHELLEK
jgi:hypothetical protein